MVSVSVFTGLYYNMIITWCFFYVFASFRTDVPWRDCGHWWNAEGQF
jgi:SNF family Na+-dependent transporter